MDGSEWHQRHIMGVLDFTEDDLAANRDGYLSKSQRAKYPKNPAVRAVAGQCRFGHGKGSGHEISIGSLDFLLPARRVLAEGEVYWCYYPADTLISGSYRRPVLSIEYAGAPRSDKYPDLCLQNIFGFGEKELAVNRDGELTDGQRLRWRRRNREILLLCILFMAMSAVLIISTLSQDSGVPLECVRGLFITLLVIAMFSLFRIICVRRALASGHVEAITGVVQGSHDSIPELVVDNTHVLNPALAEQRWAFIPGERYTIYTLPLKTRIFDRFDPILSAEHHPEAVPASDSDDARPAKTPVTL